MMPQMAAVIMAQLIAAASPSGEPKAEKQPELAVLVAAVHWAVDRGSPKPGVLYLAVENHQDPPDALLSQLVAVPNLRRVSECPKAWVGGKQFPKPAQGDLVLLLHSLTWHNKKRASVWVVRYSGPESAIGCREYFALRGAQWQHVAPGPNEGTECGVA